MRLASLSSLPFVWLRLVERNIRDELGSREVEGRRLIELKFGLRRAACGGDRGGRCGRSRWRRMRYTVEGRVMKEMIRISPPQAEHRSGSTSW